MADQDRFGLKLEVLEKLINVFIKHPDIQQVIVYGSRAKGNYRAGSDIDMTMKGSRLEWSDLHVIEQEIDDLMLPYKVDLSIYNQIDNAELREHIERRGIPLR